MFLLKTEHSFDSAHFLADYDGKCRNIHGHEWRVVIEIYSETLTMQGQTRDMIVDFSRLKKDVKHEVDALDHSLIIERGSLKKTTLMLCMTKISKLSNCRIVLLLNVWQPIFIKK